MIEMHHLTKFIPTKLKAVAVVPPTLSCPPLEKGCGGYSMKFLKRNSACL